MQCLLLAKKNRERALVLGLCSMLETKEDKSETNVHISFFFINVTEKLPITQKKKVTERAS